MAVLIAFYRGSKPVPLTASEYAARSGMSFHQAKAALSQLARAKLVRRTEHKGRTLFHLVQP